MLGIRNKYWSAGLPTDEFHPTLIFGTWIVCETVVARQLPDPEKGLQKKKKIIKTCSCHHCPRSARSGDGCVEGPARIGFCRITTRVASTEPISELSRECLLCHSLSRANTRDCDRLCTRKLKRQALHCGSISVGGSRETCISEKRVQLRAKLSYRKTVCVEATPRRYQKAQALSKLPMGVPACLYLGRLAFAKMRISRWYHHSVVITAAGSD